MLGFGLNNFYRKWSSMSSIGIITDQKIIFKNWRLLKVETLVHAWLWLEQLLQKMIKHVQHWDHHWSEDYLQKLKTFEGRNSCTCLALPWMTLQKMIKHVQHWEHHWLENNLPKVKTFEAKNSCTCLALAWTTFTENDQVYPAFGTSLILKIFLKSGIIPMLDMINHSV